MKEEGGEGDGGRRRRRRSKLMEVLVFIESSFTLGNIKIKPAVVRVGYISELKLNCIPKSIVTAAAAAGVVSVAVVKSNKKENGK